MNRLRHHLGADSLHEAQTLVADGSDLHLGARFLELAQTLNGQTKDVGVQAAAQSLVGGDQHQAGRLDGFAADQKRMPVFGIGVGQVGSDIAYLVAVGARPSHPLLRLAHFGRGDHFHRLGDLARVLHALDLVADFSGASHGGLCLRLRWSLAREGGQNAPVLRNDSTTPLSASSSSFDKSLEASTRSTHAACWVFMWSCSAVSKGSTLSTGSSSR